MGLKFLKLTVTTAISVILFAANVTVSYAADDQSQLQQQQQQPQGVVQLFLQQLLTSNSLAVQNGTTTFQSTNNGFRLDVPQGWLIQDKSTTGFTLVAEVLQGYGLLAQLCPPEQQALLVSADGNSSDVTSSTDNGNACEKAQEIIHVVRYPNLDARVGFASGDEEEDDDDNNTGVSTANNTSITPDAILVFELLKLQEVGYHDIRIISSVDRTINVISPALNNNVIGTVPAKFVEMTYSTNLAPNETRRGYFLSAATDLTAHNLGTTTGYGVFYERSSAVAAETTASSVLPVSVPVTQVFNSFELIAGPEVEQAIVAQLQALAIQEQEVVEAATADALTVEIDSNDTEGVAPATFELEADIKGGTEPYTVNWDLNDDGIVESNEQDITATFEAGTYNVVLTVADIDGQIASDTVKIRVEEGEEIVSTVEEDEEVGGEGGELQLAEEEDESLMEETAQEETSCDSLYPFTCLPSYPQLNLNSPEPDNANNNNLATAGLLELYGSDST